MPEKLSSAVSNFIRSVFGREQKLKQDLSISANHRLPVNQMVLSQLPGIDAAVFGQMQDTLGLDRRRLYRYSDYEEMDEYPDISGILDIYADDSTAIDGETGRMLWVECQNGDVRTDLEDVFYKRLRIEEDGWEISRQTCKIGNDFEEIIVGDNGVVGLNYLPYASMHRIEGPGRALKGFVQSYATDLSINASDFPEKHFKEGGAVVNHGDAIVYEDWRVVHFRLRSGSRDAVYGQSVAEPARWVFKRLKLLEDAVMVYKLTRSPSRYLFTIDVTGLGAQQAERKLQEAKMRMKKRKFINPQTGKPDFRTSPLSMDEDFFVGVRDGKEQTRVETLNGPAYQQVEDVEYFLHKLYAAMKIPRAYMGDDSNMPSKATLSSEDARFGRSILRIQNELRNGFHKIARVHLAARNIDPSSVDFKILMTVPSAIFELGQMEIRRARADLAAQMERHVSLYWLLSNIYGMSDDEIVQVMKQKESESKKAQSMGGGFESIGSGRNVISERELFGGNKEHEKQIEEIVKRAMESQNNRMGLQLRQTQYFVRELLHALQGRRAA